MKINRIVKLKLVDARLYFVSLIVGLLTGLVAVPYHYLLQLFFNMRKNFFQSSPPWYYHIVLFLALWGILCFVARMARRWPYIGGGGISQTRGVINGRIEYAHSFRQLLAKFAGGVLTLSSGLSMGREGPSVQMGSYIGDLVSKWGHILSGERKQLLAAGAGAGLAAAFAAPLAAATLVIESIERFDAPKTAITTILAGVVARSDRQYDFPDQPVPRHTGHRARPVDGTAYQAVYPVCRHRIGFRQTLFTADAIRQTDVPGHPATRIYQAVRSSGHGVHHFADGH